MAQYLIQTVLFQLVFLLLFETILKKETFFTYNRWYLLLTPLLALVLPLIPIEGLGNAIPAENMMLLPEIIIGKTAIVEEAPLASSPISGSGSHLWLIVYGLGVLLSLLLFVRKYRLLNRLRRNKVISRTSGVRIIEIPDSRIACTFFKTIFLGEQLSEEERNQILFHEMIHVHQKHSLDLLYFELLRILFWFNPLIYLYQSRISTLHEYMADAGVVRTTEKKTYYQQLLNTAFHTENISFINQFFNHSLIKKRIVMLQKSQSTTIAKLKFLVLFPVVFCMLSLVSYGQETGKAEWENEKASQLVIHVESLSNLTSEEKEKLENALAALKEGTYFSEVIIKQGLSRTVYAISQETGEPIVVRTVKVDPARNIGVTGDVPFMLIEDVPIFPGCEGLGTEKEKKNCLTSKIMEHVVANFDTGVSKGLNLKEEHRKVYVQFRINSNGETEVIDARGPAPEIEVEARRVVNLLPKMTPGKHKGEAVNILYSLPIVFRAGASEKSE